MNECNYIVCYYEKHFENERSDIQTVNLQELAVCSNLNHAKMVINKEKKKYVNDVYGYSPRFIVLQEWK